MLNDFYYFGNYTPNGWASIIKDKNCTEYRRISLYGYPSFAKQQVFKRIKSILISSKICYIDLTINGGSMGIICEKLKFILVDGELVNLDNAEKISVYDYISAKSISENEEKIQQLELEQNRTEMKCERFLTACKSVSEEMRRIDSRNVDMTKLNRFSSKLWKKYGGRPLGKVGVQEKRFVTSITKDGVELNLGAFDKLCENVALIYDKTGACSSVIVDKIRSYAISSGYDVVSCICPVKLEVEHIIIPQLRLGVFTSRYYHRAEFKKCEKFYAAKFHINNSPSVVQRLDFSHKAYKSLMNEVFDCVAKTEQIEKERNVIFAGKTDLLSLVNSVQSLIFQ